MAPPAAKFAVNSRHAIGALLLLFALSSCARSTENDRQALTGKWVPEDGSGHLVFFRPDGVLDYVYDTTVPVVQRLRWELGRKGEVYVKGDDGSAIRTCYYTIEGDKLSIDNGSGRECIGPWVTPPVPMPRAFRKGK